MNALYKAVARRFRSKTWRFGMVLFVAGALEQGTGLVGELVSEEYRGVALAVVGLVVWLLRELTREPLSSK